MTTARQAVERQLFELGVDIEHADSILSALDKAGYSPPIPKEPDDEFWAKVKFHDGRFSKSGETYPVQRNLWRAMLSACKEEAKG
jgi:hypothetical protein